MGTLKIDVGKVEALGIIRGRDGEHLRKRVGERGVALADIGAENVVVGHRLRICVGVVVLDVEICLGGGEGDEAHTAGVGLDLAGIGTLHSEERCGHGAGECTPFQQAFVVVADGEAAGGDACSGVGCNGYGHAAVGERHERAGVGACRNHGREVGGVAPAVYGAEGYPVLRHRREAGEVITELGAGVDEFRIDNHAGNLREVGGGVEGFGAVVEQVVVDVVVARGGNCPLHVDFLL